LLVSAGNKKGSNKAIKKFVNSNEKATYSTFLLSMLMITGAAIAVGAIAVTKAVWAN
jgi:hypothetical protein